MPTYDYACKECGHQFEAFQSMKDPVLTTCPQCGTEALQRLIGAGAGLLFKGSGYYLTDYKKSASSPSGSANGNGSGTDSASGSASTTESTSSESSSSAKPAASASKSTS